MMSECFIRGKKNLYYIFDILGEVNFFLIFLLIMYWFSSLLIQSN